MSRKLTKKLYESMQVKLDAATAVLTGKSTGDTSSKGKGKGPAKRKSSSSSSSSSSKKGKKAKTGAARGAAGPKGMVPSTAEERLKRNVSLLKKLGAHRTQANVLKKVMAAR